jgi:hypothetical protein
VGHALTSAAHTLYTATRRPGVGHQEGLARGAHGATPGKYAAPDRPGIQVSAQSSSRTASRGAPFCGELEEQARSVNARPAQQHDVPARVPAVATVGELLRF